MSVSADAVQIGQAVEPYYALPNGKGLAMVRRMKWPRKHELTAVAGGAVALLLILTAVVNPPVIGKWLQDWQILVSCLLTLGGAAWVLKSVRFQIWRTQRAERSRRFRVARMKIILQLDAFIDACTDIAIQSDNYRSHGPQVGAECTSIPIPPFADSTEDLADLEADEALPLVEIVRRIRRVNTILDYEANFGDETEQLAIVSAHAAECALAAEAVCETLARRIDLPTMPIRHHTPAMKKYAEGAAANWERWRRESATLKET